MRISDEDNAALMLETIPKVMMMIREELRSVARGRFTVPQFRILNKLRKQPLSNGELAGWMGIAAPTMSRMIDTLESKKLIERHADPSDRRAQIIHLTAQGKREIAKIRKAARERLTARVERFSDSQSVLMNQALQLLSALPETPSETPDHVLRKGNVSL